MSKSFLVKLKEFLSLADIFGYVILGLIACTIWIGYQKANNVAATTRIAAKLKINSISKDIKDLTSKDKESEAATSIKEKAKETTDSFFSYLNKAKEKLSTANLDSAKETAKNTVNVFNNSVNEVITGVTSEYLDPRDISKSSPTTSPKHKTIVEPESDSLAPL